MNQEEFKKELTFSFGEANEAYAEFFSGESYLSVLNMERLPVYNVSFEPGCRNNWHVHHKGGQVLLCTAGEGIYQAAGEAPRHLRPGDVVNIPPETRHWHGATKNSWFSHIAIEVPAEGSSNQWMEPVTEDDYRKACNA